MTVCDYWNDASIFILKVLFQQITLALKSLSYLVQGKETQLEEYEGSTWTLEAWYPVKLGLMGDKQNSLFYDSNVLSVHFGNCKKSVGSMKTLPISPVSIPTTVLLKNTLKNLWDHTQKNLSGLFNYLICLKFTQLTPSLPHDGIVSEEVWFQCWGEGLVLLHFYFFNKWQWICILVYFEVATILLCFVLKKKNKKWVSFLRLPCRGC